MKIALIAAALLMPLPASASTWWMYQTHPVLCVPLASMFKGTPAHVNTPDQLVAELQREGSPTTSKKFKETGDESGSAVDAVEIDTYIQGDEYQIDLFTSRKLCIGWLKFEALNPNGPPTAGSITPVQPGDKSI